MINTAERVGYTPSETEIGENLWSVAPGIVRISPGFPNMYVVGGETKSAIIDTGWGDREEVDAIVEQVEATEKPLGVIFLTHGHPDHEGGVEKLKELFPKVPVIGLDKSTQDKVRRVDLGNRVLTAIPSQGHTEDSRYVFDSKSRALFTGDNILGDLTGDIEFMKDYMDGLGALISLNPQIICPGHYESNFNASQALVAILRHREERERQVVEAFDQGQAASLDQLFDRVYGEEYKKKKGMAVFQIESHLIKLEEEGKVIQLGEEWMLKSAL